MIKSCTRCGQDKDLADFPHRKDRPLPRCKACEKNRIATWKQANKDKVRAAKKRWDETNVVRKGEHNRRNKVKTRYGLRPSDISRLRESQEGLCDICKRPPGAGGLHLDHDHVTGKARAILCFGCNSGLGQFREDPAVLARAIEYLARHK